MTETDLDRRRTFAKRAAASAVRCATHERFCPVNQVVNGVPYAICKARRPWHVVRADHLNAHQDQGERK